MTQINNWNELVAVLEGKTDVLFVELLTKVNRHINSNRFNKNFNPTTVIKSQQSIFDTFKLIYEQLSIETDTIEIFTEITSLTTNNTMTFLMTGVGKWIKFHGKETSNIHFIDDDKTIISDRTLADFLNKITEFQNQYTYFGKKPLVYYKFKDLPSDEILEYIKTFDVIPCVLTDVTPSLNYDKDNFESTLLLDQASVLTLCSNLSWGYSDTFYQLSQENKTKQQVIANKLEMDNLILGKRLLVNKSVYDGIVAKIDFTAGPTEKNRFENISKYLEIVEDCINPRFFKMKDSELICTSVAERECATIVTNNKHVWKKIKLFYKEIPCKLFVSVQLTETKYN